MSKSVWISVVVIVAIILVVTFLVIKPINDLAEDNSNSNENVSNGAAGIVENGSTVEDEGDIAGALGPKTHNVEMKGIEFRPQVLNISVGDAVRWTNMESATHTVISNSGSELLSERMYNGGVYEHTFNIAGTYEYHCSLHNNMPGKIVVK